MSEKKVRVISRSQLPVAPLKPLGLGAILWLYLDRYHAPEWLVAVLATLFVILVVVLFCAFFGQEQKTVIFEEDMKEESGSWTYKKMWNRGKMQ